MCFHFFESTKFGIFRLSQALTLAMLEPVSDFLFPLKVVKIDTKIIILILLPKPLMNSLVLSFKWNYLVLF